MDNRQQRQNQQAQGSNTPPGYAHYLYAKTPEYHNGEQDPKGNTHQPGAHTKRAEVQDEQIFQENTTSNLTPNNR